MSEPLPGYALHEQLGRGTAATVWRAEAAGQPGRVVAIKRLHGPSDPAAVADLRGEAEALDGLSHPSILRLLAVVDDGDGVALVLSYAPGGSLATRIAEADEGLTPLTVADLGARLGSALSAAHNLELVHRDIKPANILFDIEGQPLLADFGTARLLTDRAAVAGTAEYLAPEVAAGAPPSARSDVYGLGVTCYEALAGTPPYAGSTPRATLRAADRGHHVPLGELIDAPVGLLESIERAISRDPGQRHTTASELAGHLDEARRELEAATGDAAFPMRGVTPTGGAGDHPDAARATPDDAGGTAGSDAGEHAHTAAGHPTTQPGASPVTGIDERSGTQLFGPAPPRPTSPAPAPERRIDRRPLVAAAVLVLALPLGVVWWLSSGDEPTPEASSSAPPIGENAPEPRQITDREPAAECDDVDPAPAGADVEQMPADVAGEGCSVLIAWDGRILAVPRSDGDPVRYELDAQDGDRLLFGDFTCDGADSAALYRPPTGELFTFDGFTPDEEVTVSGEPTGVTEGDPRVVTDDDGCDRVEIDEA